MKTKGKKNKRFDMYQFDRQTFVVFDKVEEREICICSNYDGWEDAKKRAKKIVLILNEDELNTQDSDVTN